MQSRDNAMVHLLGITHKFQIRSFKPWQQGGLIDYDPDLARRFEKYLEDIVACIVPVAICEEESNAKLQQVSQIDDRAYSVAKIVCARNNIRHILCDPDNVERAQLYCARGVTEADDQRNGYSIREEEWLRRIRPMLPDGRLVFICGANHVESFREKLERSSTTVKILCRDLEQEWSRTETRV